MMLSLVINTIPASPGDLLDENDILRTISGPIDAELYNKEIEWKQVDVSMGVRHTCGISISEELYCWGTNNYGELGTGSGSGNSPTPKKVDSLPGGLGAANVSVGSHHTCALLTDGNVSCWGNSADGALGVNLSSYSVNQYSPLTPVDLGSSRKAIQIESGAGHTCALLDDGNVSCWGNNNNGVLGNSGTNQQNYNTPQQVSSFGNNKKAVKISSGYYHVCAILDDGSVSCWGHAGYGQLGNGQTGGYQTSPVQTNPLGSGRTAINISTGDYFTCVLLDTGSPICWGEGTNGRLGRGSNSHVNQPASSSTVSLPNSSSAIGINSGLGTSCATLTNGSISCWGYNPYGQVGRQNSANGNPTTPQPVMDVGHNRTVLDYDSNGRYSCVVLDDYSLKCWTAWTSGGAYVGVGQNNFQTSYSPGE